MTMIGSFEGYLMVFKDTKLAWTAKMQTQPIYVDRANFQGVNGLIVSLSDSGLLQIGYLGTDQLTQTELGKLHQNDTAVDYSKMEKQHA